MDIPTISKLIQGMIQISSEEILYGMECNSYPHMDEKNRSKAHRRHYKLAFPQNFERKTLKSSEIQLI